MRATHVARLLAAAGPEGGAAHDALRAWRLLEVVAAERALPDFARPVAWLQLPTTDGLKPRRHELTELAAARLANRR